MISVEKAKPILMGAVGGAVALAIVGFGWGGWVTGGTADEMAEDRAGTAVVAALAPICVAQFQQQSGFDGRLSELSEIRSFQRATYIEDGGWSTMPGSEAGNKDVARACAEMISELGES
ncbi:MAG: hypothetical protein OEU92_30060 [Alphaproteobacteria bacterium]|nr:hypothetical protein [Alphaproteobacteria bacterium]